MRPRLRESLVRLWRDRHTLQLGLDPARAFLITGLDPALARLLAYLDGTRTPAELYDLGGRLGITPARVRALLDLLARQAVLEDADLGPPARAPGDRLAPDRASAALLRSPPDAGAGVLARRATAVVAVHGAGRVGSAVANLLAAAGVGAVEVTDRRAFTLGDAGPAGDTWTGVRKHRETAVREALRRTAPEVRLTVPPGRRGPDVAVIAPEGRPEPELAARLMARGTAHLYADVHETTGVVGPFVLPGRAACGRCLDLHRRDRDPAWPRLLTQLAALPGPSPGRACDGVLATAVAARVALQVLMHLEGDTPTAADATFHIALPDGASRRRSRRPHPECDCGAFSRRAGTTARVAPPPGRGPSPVWQGGTSSTMESVIERNERSETTGAVRDGDTPRRRGAA
ncbi:ThiF family adenylyltransferase [Yinghuangia sp. ASG 101]|uniref:ThiF family adenylyltransferase n=1 Tax=Yinghuangia sp. ASG 101 TaxID=2896848 RepID=UPI001E4EF771|nr:ThiF family adenylyltransferase [Yinghuangia sp. ASG 101]UGQ14386.1 ThiF family adenylyltransferase [Yinghuangia sp. ASG 101]